ncbi:MAG: hypothetical protein ACP5I4_06315 [Oceanipulchritudo sp.]
MKSGPRRVFVLVDQGIAKGVFLSWEAAETYADENRLSLDHLMEYETRRDYPDHLHLMAAKWDGDWQFQGEWTRNIPQWPKPPRKVRLDHYHAKGDGFQLLRQREFIWEPNLLGKINPMAPDAAIMPRNPKPSSGTASFPEPQWKPKLAPLKPLKPTPPEGESFPESGKETPVTSPENGDSPPVARSDRKDTAASDFPQPEKPKLSLRSGTPPPLKPDAPVAPVAEPKKPKIAFQKRQPLRLKKQVGPKPIPSFKPVTPPPMDPHTGKMKIPRTTAPGEIPRGAPVKKPGKRRLWPMRLIIALVALVAGWAGGLYWALRPEPTAAEISGTITSLANARTMVIEPQMVFFQLPVDPVHQHRWQKALGLNPISRHDPIPIPTFHTLSTWEKPEGFIRPPYGVVEVEEWWNIRTRKVSFGFIHEWEDGSVLILDLESDLLIGWANVHLLKELLN